MFAVERCLYPRADGDTMDGWIINHTDAYPFWANKFLHKMSMGSPQTARQYAYKLCKYLNYLQDCWHIGYADATAKHLTSFLRFLQFGNVIPFVGAVEGVSVNVFFTIFTNAFSPIAPTRMRQIRQRGCTAFGA